MSLDPLTLVIVCREQWEPVTYECFLHSEDLPIMEDWGLSCLKGYCLKSVCVQKMKFPSLPPPPFPENVYWMWMLYEVCILFCSLITWVSVNCIWCWRGGWWTLWSGVKCSCFSRVLGLFWFVRYTQNAVCCRYVFCVWMLFTRLVNVGFLNKMV